MKPIIEKLKADVLELEQAWAALEETRAAKEPVVESVVEPTPEVETAPEVEVAGTQTAPTE